MIDVNYRGDLRQLCSWPSTPQNTWYLEARLILAILD
jgi:hypothetical protein